MLPIGRDVTLEDRYLLPEGKVLSTGVQAAVRAIFDQLRADRRAQQRTAAFVSGYRGSPLGGLDMELSRQRTLRAELDVVHRPAINEELGATSVWGSQVIQSLPGPRVDGVLGVWYGKAPGLDRACDALRHGNFVGAHPQGGLLALCGDDPENKSSTLPSASEATLAGLEMPVFYPATPQEVLDLTLHAVAASRASGLWVGVKLVTSVADGVASIEVGPHRCTPHVPQLEFDGRPYVHVPSPMLVAPYANEMERTLHSIRLELAREYARLNPVNSVVLRSAHPRLGLIAAGAAYCDMREALSLLGLDEPELRARGVSILKLGVTWPLEPQIVRQFAAEVEEIVVVEAKLPFIEQQVREILYTASHQPRVLGKTDEEGMPLVVAHGEPSAHELARALGARLQRLAPTDAITARLRQLGTREAPERLPELPVRTAAFCSGCPHNLSTEAPADQLVGAGIGCHSMVTINPAGRGTLTGITQMGAEGAQWLGQAPFITEQHLTQNMGDGTFSHSGSLSIRAAVAANANLTFKLLYNGAVAMTGGQDVDGAMAVPALTRWFEAEGVQRVIITTDQPDRYHDAELSSIAEVRDRSELARTQEELRRTPGVTVLVHDQACAAELRRLRKRGKAPERPIRIAINERVCEGCGDCGRKSHCLSVAPVDTEFGAKTQIHQASCNTDYSCLEGDCPSFLRILPGKAKPRGEFDPPPHTVDPKLPTFTGAWTIRMIGIGGTGVVTVAQILGMAALLDGRETLGLDQTGLAQKGGPVVSDVRILSAAEPRGVHSNRSSPSTVDAYLGFDLLGAANPANLRMAQVNRTIAIVSTSEVQTASMVGRQSTRFRAVDHAIAAIDRSSDAARNVYLDAHSLAQSVFGDHMASNLIVLGAAWQRGAIPVSRPTIEAAIRLNGVAVEASLAAFDWGRAAVADPDAVAGVGPRPAPPPRPDVTAQRIIDHVGAAPDSELARLVTVRVVELIAYQSARYAKRYSSVIRRVHEHEQQTTPGHDVISESVARQLFRLMAYKDEYEVARLHLDPGHRARLAVEFGEDAKIHYMLHPPVLRALGLQRKLALGAWFDPVLRSLRAIRVVRGTPFDVFGYAAVRRVERSLVSEYEHLVDMSLPHLASAPEAVLAACELPDLVRGYESIKLRNVETFRHRVADCLARFAEPASRERDADTRLSST